MIKLDVINSWGPAEAREAFLKCCGSRTWAEQMVAGRPYATDQELLDTARNSWRQLGRQDWLEAFAAHPKIGERSTFAKTAAWSATEQAGMDMAAEVTRRALSDGNRCYEQRFGYIFIVCASGKSAAEMLSLLERRLNNSRDDELRVAAAEQEKITLVRLQKVTS